MMLRIFWYKFLALGLSWMFKAEILSNGRDTAYIEKDGTVNFTTSDWMRPQDSRYYNFVRFIQKYTLKKYGKLPFPEYYELEKPIN